MRGQYVKDLFAVGSASPRLSIFAMVQDGEAAAGGGLFALGFNTSEFKPKPKPAAHVWHPTILDTMFKENVIDSRSFGLYLNKGSKWSLHMMVRSSPN